jgi:hypothetical protein
MEDYRELKKIDSGQLGSMFHSLLFAYEKVFLNFYGKEESKALFSYLIEELIPILYDEKNLVVDNSLSIEENVNRFAHFISNDDFIKGLKFTKISDNEYTISLEECAFAKEGIHSILDMKGGSCPYALLAAAVLSSVEGEDQYIQIGESEFTELGSKTILKIE